MIRHILLYGFVMIMPVELATRTSRLDRHLILSDLELGWTTASN